jgi:hypothetical protein
MIVIGCGEDPPPPAPRSEPAPPPAPIASPRAIASETAFAITATDEGAVLFYGAPYSERGGLRAVVVGPHGETIGQPFGQDVSVWSQRSADAASPIVEVEAAATGRLVGVVWLVDHGARVLAYSAYSNDGGRTFAEAVELGPSVSLPRDRRGRLSIAANEEGQLRFYQRVEDGPCVGEARGETCAIFVGRAVGSDLSGDERGVERREVARPCDPLVSGLRWHGGTRYVSICDLDGDTPQTTVVAIRPAIDWAAITEHACAPAGIAPLDQGIVAFTACDRAYVLDEMGGDVARLDAPVRTPACAEGRVELRLSSGSITRRLRLAGAADHLEALLPPTIAEEGARAVWTGEAMLVALRVGREVKLRRYACARGRFDRTDVR